jgi:hypothetical protein
MSLKSSKVSHHKVRHIKVGYLQYLRTKHGYFIQTDAKQLEDGESSKLEAS